MGAASLSVRGSGTKTMNLVEVPFEDASFQSEALHTHAPSLPHSHSSLTVLYCLLTALQTLSTPRRTRHPTSWLTPVPVLCSSHRRKGKSLSLSWSWR